MVKVASLFCGIGGFEKGFLQADPNTQIVFSSEIDKYARQIYTKNYGVEPHGDITKINETDIPGHDILCGGFPCQDVSISGKRVGLCGARSGLFYDIIRILREKQPKLVFLENVEGLLSSNRGWDFAKVIIEMEGVGYTCEWEILNSKDYGVPQNRKRVFIIGHLRGSGGRKIFPIREDDEAVDDIQKQTTNCLTSRYERAQSTGSYIIESKFDAQALTEARTDEAKEIRRKTKGKDFSPRRGKKLVPRNDGIANCITSANSKEQLVQIARCLTGGGNSGGLHSDMTYIPCHSTLPRSSKSGEGGTGPLSKHDGTTYCIDAANNIAVEVEHKIRRLTPVECERLQGFPDFWTAEGVDSNGNIVEISDTQRYKCLGNAVTVPVIEFLARRIFKMLGEIS